MLVSGSCCPLLNQCSGELCLPHGDIVSSLLLRFVGLFSVPQISVTLTLALTLALILTLTLTLTLSLTLALTLTHP